MFCTNCGKKLHDGDKFCANCGTKVRKDTPEVKPVSNDIVFNPPFKVEAEKRTNEIYRGFVSDKPAEEKKRTAEPVNFDWNLSGFPQETRKTDDVDFNWDSVVERRNQQRRDETRQEYRQDAPAPVVTKLTSTKLKNSLLRTRRRQMLCLKKIFWQLFLYPAA